MGCCDVTRGKAAASSLIAEGLDVELVHLDVSDGQSVQAAAADVTDRYGRLDVLVNNAGITSGLAPASEVSVADLRRTFETNVFGLVAVTNAFLPLLRESGRGRVINLSSELGSPRLMSDPLGPFAALNNAAYQASKSAVDMLTVLYAKELAAHGVVVSAVGPGYRATDLNGGLPTPGAGDPADGAEAVVKTALQTGSELQGKFVNQHQQVVPW